MTRSIVPLLESTWNSNKGTPLLSSSAPPHLAPNFWKKEKLFAVMFEESEDDIKFDGSPLGKPVSAFPSKRRGDEGPSKILEWLYLGSKHHALNKSKLLNLEIECILNVVGGSFPDNWTEDTFLLHPMSDYGTDKLREKLNLPLQFLHQVKTNNRKCLVHCQMGINRSPTVVIAYLVKHENMDLLSAIELVVQKRSIKPHRLYLKQLRTLEREWKNIEESTLSDADMERLFPDNWF